MSSQRAVAVMPFRSLALYERLLQAGAFLLPLLWWGGMEDGFVRPKLWLLAAIDGVLALRFIAAGSPTFGKLRASRLSRAGEPLVLAWLAVLALSAIFGRYISLDALLLAILPLPLAWALWEGLLPGDRIRAAVLWGSAAESAIALLQYARLDPFRLLWSPDLSGSSRMRVYGTIGNPDFVAAWLCATLPLHACDIPSRFTEDARGRRVRVAAFGVQLAAILATGSRLLLIALPVFAIVLLMQRRSRTKWLLASLLPLAAMALFWFSPARPLSTTVGGRLYLARIGVSDWQHTPLLGYGPGSFRLLFGTWQTEWIREHGAGAAAAQFAGPVDHAHNDYIEFFSEYGVAGLAAFLLLSGWLLWRWGMPWGASPRLRFSIARNPPGARHGSWRLGVLGAIGALLAIAVVDFPFHRPAEWTLYWVLLGMLGNGRSTPLPGEKSEQQ